MARGVTMAMALAYGSVSFVFGFCFLVVSVLGLGYSSFFCVLANMGFV